LASPAFAQPPGGGRGGMMQMGGLETWLSNASVQEHLKLDDQQKEKIKDFAAKLREAQQALRNPDLSQEERAEKRRDLTKQAETFAKEILTADQLKRIKQIDLQQAGLRAFAREEIAKELKLTDEQKEKIKTLGDDMRKDVQELRQGGGDPQENMQKMRSLGKEYLTKAAGVLTADQKKQWEEMVGKAFEVKFVRPNDR